MYEQENILIDERKFPSLNNRDYWIYHYSSVDYPKHTKNGGKWMIFCNSENVDSTWDKIKYAQDLKLLGNTSKVSTALTSKNKNKNFVICIYTYDFSDKEDVLKIRENLKKIGFTLPLKYKTDENTRKGIYGKNEENLTV